MKKKVSAVCLALGIATAIPVVAQPKVSHANAANDNSQLKQSRHLLSLLRFSRRKAEEQLLRESDREIARCLAVEPAELTQEKAVAAKVAEKPRVLLREDVDYSIDLTEILAVE